MTSFVALYRGNSVRESKMVGVTDDPALVSYIASRMLDDREKVLGTADNDPVLDAVEHGHRGALRLIAHGHSEGVVRDQ